MWIKTFTGVLLNSDSLESILYARDLGHTAAYMQSTDDYDRDYIILAKGDCTEKIIGAIIRGSNYVEVN